MVSSSAQHNHGAAEVRRQFKETPTLAKPSDFFFHSLVKQDSAAQANQLDCPCNRMAVLTSLLMLNLFVNPGMASSVQQQFHTHESMKVAKNKYRIKLILTQCSQNHYLAACGTDPLPIPAAGAGRWGGLCTADLHTWLQVPFQSA